MFKAAGLSMVEHTTTHAGHATAIVQQLQLQGLRAVVLVGGDGTVWEALQVMCFSIPALFAGLFRLPLPDATFPTGSYCHT